jgi:integrase
MRNQGSLYKQHGSNVWHCYYRSRGKRYRQSTHETDEKKAQAFLDGKMCEVGADRLGARPLVTPKMSRLTVGDLLEKLKIKYQDNGQDSAQNLSHIKRAVADLGHYRAIGLDADTFDTYKRERLANGDKLASIQRVLQMVRCAYNYARKHDHFPQHDIPFIQIKKENNTRRECYSEAEFQMIYKNLRPYLADFALFAIRTAMRFSEIASLKWENMDGDTIVLLGADAKGDGGGDNERRIPMAGKDLAAILQRRRAAQRVKGKGNGTPPSMAEFIFHHGGQRIVDIRKNWASAIRAAGLPHYVFHTLRHSAIRAFDDAGLSRDVAMSLSGHKTQAMYSRYNVSDVARKRTALERAQEFAALMATKEQPANVVSMQR